MKFKDAGPSRSSLHKWNDASAFFYSSYVTPWHSHNTMQVVFDTQGAFRLRVENGSWQTYRALLIQENVIHQLDTNNSVQLIVYLDAQSEMARQLKNTYLKGNVIGEPVVNLFHLISSQELQLAFLQPEPERLQMLVYQLIHRLVNHSLDNTTEERIRQVQQIISTTHPQDLTQRMLAKSICLSESRLRSLFRQVTGVSLHQYYLLNKIRFATNQIFMGASISDAALEAGFTDSSHLTKMTTKFFNTRPSGLINRQQVKVVRSSDSPLKFKTTVHE